MLAKTKIGSLSAGLSYSSTLPAMVQDSLIRSLEDTSDPHSIPEFIDKQPEARE